MKHKLGICIPYRNRKDHLDRLIPHLSAHLNKSGIQHKFYVGHQIDDKLFNRGAMKNIAAHFAFEDGCDYIAWHDVDMLALEECEYSYPEITPIHIATKLSKYNYGLGYTQYFGGVVLFNKEQALKTNGYSNDYWDWGQEDDDLFWRCYYENYTTGKILQKYYNRQIAYFDGENSHLIIPINREISSCLNNDFTISILVYAEQQPDKVPIWLIGDNNKRFIEYPILRKDNAYNWGISFNNSRAITMTLFDRNNRLIYNWGKRSENLWTWVTLSYSKELRGAYFYINNELTCQMDGIKQNIPFPILDDLKIHSAEHPLILGKCSNMNTLFKGKIAEFKLFNTFKEDVNDAIKNTDDLVLHYDFNDSKMDKINNIVPINHAVKFINEDIELIENILPYRREGRFDCMPHVDEGFVNGKWAKGNTTARNERRFVTEMQQRKIDYKKDGLMQIMDVLKINEIDSSLYDNTKFINCFMTNNEK